MDGDCSGSGGVGNGGYFEVCELAGTGNLDDFYSVDVESRGIRDRGALGFSQYIVLRIR